MPKQLTDMVEYRKYEKRRAGKKIEFGPIVQQIVKSGQFWGVTEVHQNLVKEQVTRFRTLNLLKAATNSGQLGIVEDEGRLRFADPKLVAKLFEKK